MKFFKKNWHLFFAIYVIVSFFIAIVYASEPNNEYITFLNDGWTLTINNELISENFNVKEDSFEILKENDVIILSRKLPDYDYNNPTLELYSTYTTIETFIDNQKIYEFGLEEHANNKMLMDGIKWINMGEIDGDTITIKMIVTENRTISSIKEISIGENIAIINNFVKENIFSVIISGFLLFLGFALLIIFVKFKTINDETKKIFFICLYALLVGSWIVARENILILLSPDNFIIKYIEYICLYSSPVPVMGFLMQLKNKITSEKLLNTRLLKYVVIIQTIFNITCFLLQFLNIIHIKQTLSVFQLMLITETIIIISNLYMALKKNIDCEKSMLWGMFAMMGTIIIDVFAYNIKIIGLDIGKFFADNTTTIGVTILLFTLINSFYLEILDTIKKSSQMEMYNKLAFTDILTNLKNRAWYEDYIKQLNNKNYTMISIDLNDLKATNDTKGHDKGDELIKTFAEILKESFNVNAHSVRFGGDEFLVILEYVDNEKMQTAINKMNEKITIANKTRDIVVSASYGIAYGTEEYLKSPTDVYKKADQRMYRMKKSIKMKKQFSI